MSRHIICCVLSCLALTLYVWGAYSLDVGCDVVKRHERNLRVICRQKHMTSLPTQWPPGCIVSLRAKRTSLYNISSLGHPQMVCLEKLNLDDNLLREVPASALSGLTRLSSLNLDRNLLKQVPTEAFRRLSSLKTLSLRFNSLETISNWAFQGLGNLRSLYLDFNFISVIAARAFDGLSSLTFLSMTHNLLVYRGLPSGLFAATTGLQSLHLEHNDNDEQGEYPRHVFHALPRLRILSIDTFSSVHFGLDFAAMTEIYDLDLGHNCSLTRLGKDSFEGFKNSSLEIIRLDWCPLHFVDTCAFCDLPRLQWISMSPGRLLPAKMAAETLYKLRQNIVYTVDLVHSRAPANRPSFAAHWKNFTVMYCSGDYKYVPLNFSDLFSVPVKTPRDAKPYIIDTFKPLASNTSASNSRGIVVECVATSVMINVSHRCDVTFVVENDVKHQIKKERKISHRFPLYILQVSKHGLQKPALSLIQKYEHLAEIRHPPSTLHIEVDPLWTELNLSQYLFEEFPHSDLYFHTVSSLRHLDMSNLGSRVCHSPIHGLENLTSLDMSGSPCFDITENMWDYLPSLQSLNFSNMALNNRQFYRRSHRLFSGISQLKYLDLSNNSLRFSTLGALHGMRNLEKLILSNNLISSLDGLDPESTPSLSVLDLSFNSINYFADHEMSKFDEFGNSRNFSLYFEGNPLLCGCRSMNFISWMLKTTLNISTPKPSYPNYKCTTNWGETMTVSQFYHEYGPFCANEEETTKVHTGLWSIGYTCTYLGPWFTTVLEMLGVIFCVLCFALWQYLNKNVLKTDTFFQEIELGRPGVKTNVHDPANSYTKRSDIMKHPHTKKNSRQTVRSDQNTNACASRTLKVQHEKASQDDAGPHYPPIVCDKWLTSASVDVEGDVLGMTGSDVILHVPPYAVNEDSTVNIQSAVCANTEHVHSVMSLSAEEEVVSPLAEYWAGMNFVFKRLVCIVLPLCLPPHPDLDQVQVHRISRDQDGRANITQLPRRELNFQENASDLLEDGPFYQLKDDGTVRVYTDSFSAYVCVYCGLRQGPVTLKAMVCGTHHQKPSGQHAVHISVHIWDRRLNIRDFREEYGVGDQGVELASMAVNLLGSTEGSYLCLRVETSGQEADQWQPSRRSDGRPTTALVQQHPFSSVVTCDNVDCDQRRLWIRPVTSHWTMESRSGSRPGAWLQCVVDISHVTAADDTPQWIDRLGRERVTTRPFLCCMETGPETAAFAPDSGDRRRYGERLPATLFVRSNSSRPQEQEPYSPLGSMSECPNILSQAPVGCVSAPIPTSPPAAGTIPMISMNQERYVLATARRALLAVQRPSLQFPSSTQFQDSPRGENEHHPSSPFPLMTQLHDSPRGDNVGQPSPEFHPRTQFQDFRGRENEQGPSRPGARCSRHQPGTLDNDNDLQSLGASGGFPPLWSVPTAGFADLNPHPLGSYVGFPCPGLPSVQYSGLEFAEGGDRGSRQLQRLEQQSSCSQHSLATHFGPAPATQRGGNGSEQHATQHSDYTTYHVQSVQSAQLAGSGHDDQQSPCASQQRLNMLSPRATHRVCNDSAVHRNAQTREALSREFQTHGTTSQLPQQAPVACDSDGDQLLDVDNPSDGSM